MLLGQMEFREAEDIMIHSLYDSIMRVRSSAIFAVGQVRSERAVDSLMEMLIHPQQSNNTFIIYGALGAIGDPDAIPVLAMGLEGGEFYNQIAALNAIMQIDPNEGLSHAYTELNDTNMEVRRNAVITCIKTGDPAVVDALSALLEDEDFEVRFYARQGIKRLEK
jgi:HEAT repeat protein